MNIHHHLDEATLISYTAGSLTNAMALVVASHLSMCVHCRRRAADLETLGALMIERLNPEVVSDDELDAVLAAIDQDPQPSRAQQCEAELQREPASPAADKALALQQQGVPYPLSELLPAELEQLSWKRMGPGVLYFDLPCQGSGACRLLKLSPGRTVLPHSHHGNELTLVLKGSYTDDLGRYAAGDIADLDEEVSHQPLVDSDEPCICLVATDAPLKFNTLLGRLVQPMTGF